MCQSLPSLLSAPCLPLRYFLHAFGWPGIGLQDGPNHGRTQSRMKGSRLRWEVVGELSCVCGTAVNELSWGGGSSAGGNLAAGGLASAKGQKTVKDRHGSRAPVANPRGLLAGTVFSKGVLGSLLGVTYSRPLSLADSSMAQHWCGATQTLCLRTMLWLLIMGG